MLTGKVLWAVLSLYVAICLAAGGDSLHKPLAPLTASEKQWLSEHPVIRVAPDPDFPPIEWFDEEGAFQGIAADYIDLLQQRLDITFRVVRCKTWDEVLEKARNREIDVLSAAAQSPNRAEYLTFSEPHIVMPGVIISRRGAREGIALDDLSGMRVTVVSGYVWQEFLSADYPALTLDLVADIRTGMRKVSFGLADAMIANVATASYYIDKEGITNLWLSGETGYESRLSLAVRNDWPTLYAILSKTLAGISKAQRASIHDRWIHLGYKPALFDRSFWIALAVSAGLTLLIIGAVIAWNRMLKKRVDQAVESLQTELAKRRRAEEALRESERQYKELVESANSIILKVDSAGVVRYFNEFAQRIFEFSADEIVGRHVVGTIVPLTDSKGRDLMVVMQDVFNNPEHYLANENENMTKSGKRLWISWANRPIYDATGGLREILCVGTDITERRQSRAALEESEKRYRFLFEESPVCNIVIGADGIVRDINRVFIQETGYSREELVGKPAGDFLSPASRKRSLAILAKRLAGETSSTEIDTEIVASDGRIHYVSFAAGQARLFKDDNVDAVLISGVDVTKRRAAEELARRQQDKLVQADKMATLGTLVSGIAHEINNPNNYIRLNSENLEDIWRELKPILEEAGTSDLEIQGIGFEELCRQTEQLIRGVREGADRIRDIVASLKNFARQEPGAMDQRVNINQVAQSSLLILANLLKKTTYQFKSELASDLPCVFGNSQRIEQVIVNLLANACQALESPHKAVRLTTAYDKAGELVIIEVQDEGKGIQTKDLAHVLDPFYTTKRDSGGTGLGLSIVYSIVTDHGGDVGIESEPGNGTTVRVTLPAAHKPEASIVS